MTGALILPQRVFGIGTIQAHSPQYPTSPLEYLKETVRAATPLLILMLMLMVIDFSRMAIYAGCDFSGYRYA